MLTLKPQWSFRSLPGGRWALTSENFHQEVLPEYAAILQKLVVGVEPDTLTDAEFDQIEYLTERGFLNVEVHPDAPAWELSGLNFHSVQEQLQHVSFRIIDLTKNGVGASVRELLLASGMREAENARLTIAVASSYLDLPNIEGNVLPVVCNRLRVTVGPMQFPWTPSVADSVRSSEHYLHEVRYTLPAALDQLQRAWIASAVLTFIGGQKLKFVTSFVEFNLQTFGQKLWHYGETNAG